MAAIKVLLVTNDSKYCHRLVPYFGKRHPEIKFSIMNYPDNLQDIIDTKKYNVILVGDEFSDVNFTPSSSVICAFISPSSSGQMINGIQVFCKYKSGDEIYKKILSLYSEVSVGGDVFTSSDNRVFAFLNANGGAGATTVAAAFCFKLAFAGKRVLYLCFDKFADSGCIYDGNVQGENFSDLFYAIKSSDGKNKNLSARAFSMLKRDSQNVEYFSECRNPLDFDSVDLNMLKKVLDIFLQSGSFNCVVIDGSFYDDRYANLVKEKADKIMIVSENNASATSKLQRFISYLDIMDKRDSGNLSDKSYIIINKDKGAGANGMAFENVHMLGVIPKYMDDTAPRTIAATMSKLDMWNKFLMDSEL